MAQFFSLFVRLVILLLLVNLTTPINQDNDIQNTELNEISFNKKAENKIPESIGEFPEQAKLEEDLLTEGKKVNHKINRKLLKDFGKLIDIDTSYPETKLDKNGELYQHDKDIIQKVKDYHIKQYQKKHRLHDWFHDPTVDQGLKEKKAEKLVNEYHQKEQKLRKKLLKMKMKYDREQRKEQKRKREFTKSIIAQSNQKGVMRRRKRLSSSSSLSSDSDEKPRKKKKKQTDEVVKIRKWDGGFKKVKPKTKKSIFKKPKLSTPGIKTPKFISTGISKIKRETESSGERKKKKRFKKERRRKRKERRRKRKEEKKILHKRFREVERNGKKWSRLHNKSYYSKMCPPGPQHNDCVRTKLLLERREHFLKTGGRAVRFNDEYSYDFDSKENFNVKRYYPENPLFSEVIRTKDTNYFELTLPKRKAFDINYTRITSFLKLWMKLKEYESIRVKRLKINGKKVANRYQLNYYNKITRQVQHYFVDFDFQNDLESAHEYIRKADVAYYPTHSDPVYDTVYEYTLVQDCKAIAKRFHDPFKIKCDPVINNNNYVLRHLYEARMVFKKAGELYTRNRLVIVVPTKPKSAKPLYPSQKPIKKLKIYTPDSLINLRVNNLEVGVPKETFKYTIEQTPEIQNKIKQVELQAEHFEDEINSQFQAVEENYQKRTSDYLTRKRDKEDKKQEAYDNTYNLILGTTDKVNSFNIETSIKFMMRRLRDIQTLRIHKKKRMKYGKMIALQNLEEQRNFLRYLQDRKLDEYFEKHSDAFRIKHDKP